MEPVSFFFGRAPQPSERNCRHSEIPAMSLAMAYRGIDYETDFERAYYVGAVVLFVVIVVAFVLRPKSVPLPPLDNAAAFGCYVSETAPPMLLAPSGLQIRQPGFPEIGFHLERHKTGIALTAEEPIKAEPFGDRYRYSIHHRGEGYHLDFFRLINGRHYGVFDADDLSGFTMVARDGADLFYEKAESASCEG